MRYVWCHGKEIGKTQICHVKNRKTNVVLDLETKSRRASQTTLMFINVHTWMTRTIS